MFVLDCSKIPASRRTRVVKYPDMLLVTRRRACIEAHTGSKIPEYSPRHLATSHDVASATPRGPAADIDICERLPPGDDASRGLAKDDVTQRRPPGIEPIDQGASMCHGSAPARLR